VKIGHLFEKIDVLS